MAEYIYGIVRPNPPVEAGAGIAGAPLRLIEGAGAAALVSPVPDREVQIGRDELMAHARVLGDRLAAGPVLPMRAGIVLSDEVEVRARLLEPHAEELRRDLDRFDGTFQADVRAVYEEEALMREAVRREPEITRLRDGLQGRPPEATLPERIRLGELVAAAIERIRETDAGNLLDVLAPLALAVDVGAPAHERVVLSASFLLDRSRAAEFDDVLEAFAEALAGRIRFRYTGPLPPHSFVELSGTA